jgi:hypothetical protein
MNSIEGSLSFTRAVKYFMLKNNALEAASAVLTAEARLA